MSVVFVVDDSAADLCVGLNSIAKRDKVDLKFEAIPTVGRMLAAITKATPDLILLHHNWEGISISKILEQIVAACDEAKVVVFTGRRVKTEELTECVRSGVVSYWERDSMTPDFIFQQSLYYCANSACTVKTLKGASGSVVQLAERAEAEAALRRDLERKCDALSSRVESLTSKERNETAHDLRKLLKRLIFLGLLSATLFVSYKVVGAGSFLSLTFAALCGIVLLFLDEKLSFAKLSFKQWTAQFRNDTQKKKR
jgi:CheY-like chemotaxis protein